MKYKKSRYNFLIPYKEGKYVIFNSFSGAIGTFNSEIVYKYENNLLVDKEIEVLAEKGIYVPAFENEIDKINRDRVDGIYSKRRNLRIWSTSACNANCYYCFEKGIKMENMDQRTADAVFNFAKDIIADADSISVEWFGGEPLMNVPIIDYLSEKFYSLFKQKNIIWKASMITNGSLFTDEIVDKIVKKWNITRVQITLDGYGEYYNKTKE